VRGSHARDDGGACHTGKLDRGDADAARGAVHQDAFTWSERALGKQSVMCDRECLREPARFQKVQRVWHGQRGALMDDHQLGLGPTADDGHDTVADGKALDTRANIRHDSRELEPGCVRGRTRRSRIKDRPAATCRRGSNPRRGR